MRVKPLPSQEYLKECLAYDPTTGKLTWRKRPASHFATSFQEKLWNGRWPGRGAFNGAEGAGYLEGWLDGVKYKTHRIIWKLVHGVDPVEVDHIDRDRTNNRLSNLRNVSHARNCWNRRIQARNTSGANGMGFRENSKGWVVQICRHGQKRYLGTYVCFGRAVVARKRAETESGVTL